jgi:hypothetical protein
MLFSSNIRSFLRKANFPETLFEFDDDDIQAHRAVRLEAARGPRRDGGSLEGSTGP